jgi:hypothetical protein
LGVNEFKPSDPLMKALMNSACKATTEEVCKNTLFLFLGFNPQQANDVRLLRVDMCTTTSR